MIDIKDISGKILKSVIETTDCKKYEELMSLCYISLSWDDENNMQLPAGSYIEYEGERYRLLEPYDPSFKNESTFQYTPKFYDKIALWSKKPLFLVTDTGEETDWSMTAYPGQFMEAVVRALSKYTGETFTYSVDASIAQSTMEYISFQNKNIFDGLTEIANKWDVEWWIEGNIIHLSKCQYGEPITLEVGKNVGIPTVTSNKDGYFTRFYAFGSTKNITQEYDDGGFTNGLVNKRLTLNPSLYPGGYMDIRPDLHPEEVFVKTLIFDNIFPSSKLVISGVRAELKDYIDSDGNKIQVGESEGKPLYKQYAIWYFKIDGFNFNNSTYDKDDNPEGMLLSGLDLSVIFESGQLNGRDFKLTYHDKTQEYEINFVEESGSIIVPGTVSLIPADGDNIVLYNIRMPEEYVSSSQEELAEALLSEMERYKRNMNSYSFPSYPVSFYEENLDMKVGQSVSFIYGGNNLSTRVLKVEKQLDYPIEQTITIGEEKIKGNTQEIKEEVIDANQNIDVVKAIADLNKAITDGYGRVQQLIMQSLSQYKGIWTLDQNGFPNDPSKWTIKTDYTAISAKDFIAFADGGEYASGLPVADFDTFGLFKAKQGGGLLFDVNEGWYVDPEFAGGGGIDEEQLKQYLTDNNYITVDYLTKQGYLTLSSPLTGYTKPEAYSPITATDTILSAIGKLEMNFDNYVDLTTNQTIGGVKTFNETILSKKDVIAYADGGEYASGLPVADQYTYGLVKVDGTTVRINADGQLEADSGGGIDFTVGTGLQLSADSVLSVKFGTTTGTACQGDDSRLSNARRNPYYLSWSGYNTGSYDGSASESFEIPNNTSQLINGAGFIKDGNGNFTTLANSGSSSQYLAGNGRFYTISHSEIDGLSSNYVTLSTTQTITGQKSYTALGWYKGIGILRVGSTSNMYIAFAEGSGNCINAYNAGTGAIGNIYLNYQATNAFTRIDPSNNLVTTGDVIAYADGGSYASGLPVADASTYGLIKYDGTTIGKNSSGQLYVIGGSGGGSTIQVIDNLTSSSTTAALSANQGRLLNQRLQSVKFGSAYTDYVPVYLGSTSYNLSRYGHTHSQYLTSHQTIHSLNLIVNGTTYTYTPNSGSKTVTISTSGSGSSWNGGTIGSNITINKDGAAILALQGYHSSWQAAQIQLINKAYTDYRRKWCIDLAGTSEQSGDLVFQNYNLEGTGSANQSPWYRFKIFKHGTATNGVAAAGQYVNNSDARLKNILCSYHDRAIELSGDNNSILDKIRCLNAKYYYWKVPENVNDEEKLLPFYNTIQLGFIAQEVEEIFPEFVSEDNGYKLLNYVGLGSVVAVEGVKELYTRFLPVENKIKILESRVQNLQLRLDNAYREIFELKQQMGGAA